MNAARRGLTAASRGYGESGQEQSQPGRMLWFSALGESSRHKMMDPRYREVKRDDIPVAETAGSHVRLTPW